MKTLSPISESRIDEKLESNELLVPTYDIILILKIKSI